MPAPLAVDREAVRTLVVAVGVREAARQLNISENTLCSWSKRGKWTEATRNAQEIAAKRREPETLKATAIKPADALANQLADDSQATRIGFSKAARKVAEKLPTMDGAELMDKDTAQAAKHWHGVAAGTHGWEQKQDPAAVMVNVALLMG